MRLLFFVITRNGQITISKAEDGEMLLDIGDHVIRNGKEWMIESELTLDPATKKVQNI